MDGVPQPLLQITRVVGNCFGYITSIIPISHTLYFWNLVGVVNGCMFPWCRCVSGRLIISRLPPVRSTLMYKRELKAHLYVCTLCFYVLVCLL